ncbi:MAG TPA: hypothetical protein VHG89_11395 [Verrucomicrobiae bacterium]|nr:hypothetical protein [Verrucomicrobiae bacterium]
MNNNENDFNSLRQLLALKRYEVPPPGYFDRFSGNVVARLRVGQHESASGKSWLFKWAQIFEAKPLMAGSFAGALCLLLLFGIVYAERPDNEVMPLLQSAQLAPQSFAVGGAPSVVAPQVAVSEQSGQNLFASISNSSPSSLQPMFGQNQNPFAQQVSFTLPGN